MPLPKNQLFIARVDKNQREIVAAFRKLGFSVAHTHMVKRFCDLVIAKDNINHLVEVKGEKGKLTPAEKEFHAIWKAPIHIIRSVEDVLHFCKWHDTLI